MKTGLMLHITASVLMCMLVISAASFAQDSTATETITLAFWAEPSEDSTWRWGELLYTEAFRRIGVDFQYKVYPPSRASFMADSGQIDGEPARIAEYAESHENLIRVDEPVVIDKVLACAIEPGIKLERWESLRNTDYRVDYYRGVAIVEKNLPMVVDPENLSAISEPILAFKKMIAGRTEVYVDSIERIVPLLNSPEFKNSGIHIVGTLAEVPSYPYLHKRHASLVSKLSEALKQMKAEGVFERYLEQAQKEFAQK